MNPRILFLFLLLACSSPKEQSPPDAHRLSYTVTLDVPARRVDVVLEMRETSEPVVLSLPKGTTQTQLEAPLVENLRLVDSPNATLTPTDDPYAWELKSAGSATLRWSVPHRFREMPLIQELQDEHEFPYLRDDHALLYSATLFLAPEQPDDIAVHFIVPEGWSVWAPWPQSDGAFFPSGEQLRDDYIALGNWREEAVSVGGFEGRLLFSPGVVSIADRLAETIARVLPAQFALWGREPEGRYQVVLGEAQENRLSGSPKSTSMTLAVDPGLTTVAPDWLRHSLVHIVAHEFHHVWTQNLPALPARLRFYKEGITDYAAWLTVARLGALDESGWRRKLGEVLEAVDELAIRETMSLADAGTVFDGPEEGLFTLAGGMLVGLWLDLSLREANYEGGLDAWMRRFNNDPARSERAPTLEHFLEAVQEDLGAARANTLRRIVSQPGGLEPATLLENWGFSLQGKGPDRFALPPGPWDDPARGD